MFKDENYINPVYAKKNLCTDCYRCIRTCPVKSIKIEDGAASVIDDKCIGCGRCVTVCPVNAMIIRNDLGDVKHLLKTDKKVYVSLAPSWVSAFPKVSRSSMIYALKMLGFHDIGETALGAESVSQEIVKEMNLDKNRMLYISSCCPSVVDYIRLYMPEYTKYITQIGSPALTHAQILKNIYGEDISIVFIGPCISKKNESDNNKHLIDYAITFQNISDWFKENRIDVRAVHPDNDYNFVPYNSNEGTMYAIEGGMNETLKCSNIPKHVKLLSVSGVYKLKSTLSGVNVQYFKEPVFLEALACAHGCINGPAYLRNPSMESIISVTEYAQMREPANREPLVKVSMRYTSDPVEKIVPTVKEMADAMATVAKYGIEDELNCAGCGYDTCYKFCKALIAGKAEPPMCVSYMRKSALKKANAVLQALPSGAVIINADLKIVEVNKVFYNMFKDKLSKSLADDNDAMTGFNISKFIPCKDLLLGVLRSGDEVYKERYPINDDFYRIVIFPIDNSLGIIIQNVTDTTLKQEEISKKAKEVIQKNIATVQEIASLLGEHIVDTEVILSSIIPQYEEDKL